MYLLDHINKRLIEIPTLGTTASLTASQPLRIDSSSLGWLSIDQARTFAAFMNCVFPETFVRLKIRKGKENKIKQRSLQVGTACNYNSLDGDI